MPRYSQTAYITECGGDYRLAGHCGTYLEVHLPNDEEILTEVHVAGGVHTGYRLTALPLNWKQDPYRLLCRGNYEVRCVATWDVWKKR